MKIIAHSGKIEVLESYASTEFISYGGEALNVIDDHSGYDTMSSGGALDYDEEETISQPDLEEANSEDNSISLDQPVQNSSGEFMGHLVDFLPDYRLPDAIVATTRRNDRIAALALVLAQLSQRQRTYIYMRYWQGRTQEEVAGELGVTKSAVERSIKRSFRRIEKSKWVKQLILED